MRILPFLELFTSIPELYLSTPSVNLILRTVCIVDNETWLEQAPSIRPQGQRAFRKSRPLWQVEAPMGDRLNTTPHAMDSAIDPGDSLCQTLSTSPTSRGASICLRSDTEVSQKRKPGPQLASAPTMGKVFTGTTD